MNNSPDWTQVPGTLLDGGYEIQELIAADRNGRSFRVRVLDDPAAQAVLKLYVVDGFDAEEQLTLWNSAKELQHPNLLTPLAAGQMQVDDASLIFIILPRAEEVLDDILRERPLTPEEAGEVLLAASQGLDQLHQRGFAHGCLSPQQVFASGESIKLSTESIRRIGSAPAREMVEAKYSAPESDGVNVTPEADAWCLGATVYEALTQNDCGENSRAHAEKLPGIFGTLIPRLIDPNPNTRCKLSEVEDLYRWKAAPVQEPAAFVETGHPQGRRTLVTESNPAARRILLYAAAALVIVLAVIWAAHRKPAPTRAVSGQLPPITQTLPPQPVSPAPPVPKTRVANPAPAPAPSHPNRAAANRPDTTVNGPIWRLVLYTYSSAEYAQKMARSIDQKHPQLHAEVFSPPGTKSAYLVIAGGQMNYEQAERLRRRALGMGMPRDSYIQNYRQ